MPDLTDILGEIENAQMGLTNSGLELDSAIDEAKAFIKENEEERDSAIDKCDDAKDSLLGAIGTAQCALASHMEGMSDRDQVRFFRKALTNISKIKEVV